MNLDCKTCKCVCIRRETIKFSIERYLQSNFDCNSRWHPTVLAPHRPPLKMKWVLPPPLCPQTALYMYDPKTVAKWHVSIRMTDKQNFLECHSFWTPLPTPPMDIYNTPIMVPRRVVKCQGVFSEMKCLVHKSCTHSSPFNPLRAFRLKFPPLSGSEIKGHLFNPQKNWRGRERKPALCSPLKL